MTVIGKIAWAKIKSFKGESLTEEEKSLAKKIGISIRSGHGTGKDCWLSWVYIWLLVCWYYSKGMVTAPTSHQLRDILWSEMAKWVRGNEFLNENIGWQTDKLFRKGVEEEKSWHVVGRTANVKAAPEEMAETLAGMHERYLIMAVDEASGVPKPVFAPLEGALTGPMNFAIIIGNPTRGNGYFFESHNIDKKNWVCLHWNSEESSIVSPDYIERMRDKYGRDSNMYRVRVLGDFPISESNTLIPYMWAMNAVDRELIPMKDDPVIRSFDIGAGGDKTVMVERKGNIVLPIEEFDNADTMKVVGWIMNQLSDDEYDIAFIDPIGIGAGVYDRLNELGAERLYPVDVRGEASDPSCFRERDSLFWKMRTAFEKGTIQIPDDEELIGELTTIGHDVQDSKGLIKIESKKDMRKRGLQSPNKADALALTFYFGDRTFARTKKDLGRKKKDKPLNWKVM